MELKMADIMNQPSSMTETVLLGPEMAQNLLNLAHGADFRNRTTHTSRISLLAEEIRKGNWADSNDCICIDDSGILINGFHRCKAVIEANMPIWVTVKRGMQRETFQNMDQGKRRSVADVLRTRNIANNAIVARAARLLFLYDRDGVESLKEFFLSLVSNTDVIKTFEENNDLILSASFIAGKKRLHRLLPPGFLAFAHYHLSREYPVEKIDPFFEGINDYSVDNNSVINALRGRLIDNMLSVGGLRLEGFSRYALFIKGWNYFIEGREVKMLRFAKKDNFPDFI